MKKSILALAIAAGLTSFAGSAKASPLTYNWSFTNDFTMGSGWGATTTGTITGTLDTGGAFTPTSATFSSGSRTGDFDFTNFNIYVNTLIVTSGILSGSYQANLNYKDLSLNKNMMGTINSSVAAANFDSAISRNGNTFSAATTDAVPEPSTYALFGIGAIGLLMVMRRKKTA